MGGQTRWDYLKAIYPRYKKVSKPLRARILDEFCQVCGYSFVKDSCADRSSVDHTINKASLLRTRDSRQITNDESSLSPLLPPAF